MRGRRKKLDRFSTLPQGIIEHILTLMPIRDALRTSILSKKWRYCWTRMPKLVFEDNMVSASYGVEEHKRYKLISAIFHVLMLHRGPIEELCLWIENKKIVSEINQIILQVSWRKTIKRFNFDRVSRRHKYKLPFSFFSMQGLEHLDLICCIFELPLMFDGFSMLKTLIFEDVTITANTLKQFLTNCPLLDEFWLVENGRTDFIGGNECTFVDLLKCVPSIRYLKISKLYMEHFAAGGMPQKLPTSLPQLKSLLLDVCFQKQDELLSTLCIINSSPNMEYISMKMFCSGEETSNTLLDLQDYSGLNLDHLKNLEITSFHNYPLEMEFVKLIISKSPVLEKARIELDASVFLDEEVKMLRGLLQVPLPRASPAANIIIERPKCVNLECKISFSDAEFKCVV